MFQRQSGQDDDDSSQQQQQASIDDQKPLKLSVKSKVDAGRKKKNNNNMGDDDASADSNVCSDAELDYDEDEDDDEEVDGEPQQLIDETSNDEPEALVVVGSHRETAPAAAVAASNNVDGKPVRKCAGQKRRRPAAGPASADDDDVINDGDDDDDDNRNDGDDLRVSSRTTTAAAAKSRRLNAAADADDEDEEGSVGGDGGGQRSPGDIERSQHVHVMQNDMSGDGIDGHRSSSSSDGGSFVSGSGSRSSPLPPPFSRRQTEIIRTQRPLGLLAQHRMLQTPSSTSMTFRPPLDLHMHHQLHRTSGGVGGAAVAAAAAAAADMMALEDPEHRRLMELYTGRRSDFDERAAGTMGPLNYVCTTAGSSTSLPPTPTSAGIGLDFSTTSSSRFDSLMDRRFIPSPPLSVSPLSGRDDPPSPIDASTGGGNNGGGHHRHWTFQEQFKQLYEMSEDTKRKEFLDELFTFMQKRGTPVNRIPIMAKQTLDLYELFRLVVSKGGLVEVINKKLWREITKGLNLPSSITSAAFTLRTQYMKYLYPFECEKLKLSTLAELQYAVDGNRREGRRPSYGGTDFSPMSTPSLQPPSLPQQQQPPALPHHLAANAPQTGSSHLQQQQQQPMMPCTLTSPTPQQLADGLNAAALAAAAAVASRTNGLGFVTRDAADRLSLGGPLQSLPNANQLRTLAECDSRAMEAAARAMQEAMVKRIEEASSRAAAAAAAAVAVATSGCSGGAGGPRVLSTSSAGAGSQQQGMMMMKAEETSSPPNASSSSSSSSKRLQDDLGANNGGSFAQPPQPQPPPAHVLLGRGGIGAAHIKLTSRNDGRSEFDASIVASMEVNGIVYQGVLFAQNPHLLGRI
jgi:hypothetical protein